MAIADLLPNDGRGLVWLVDVSTDNFSTVSYRWATASGVIGGNFYEERVLSVGNIQREFGNNHLPVSNTLSLEIDNTDFGADFLVGRTTVESTVFKARFRVSVGLTDDTANTYQATVLTQQVGIFVCLDFPVRSAERIALSLADDALGQLSDLIVPPSPMDWYEAEVGVNTSPFGNISGTVTPLVDWETPLPLQFGGPSYIGAPLCGFSFNRLPADFQAATFGAGRRKYIFPIVVLATRDDAAYSSTTDAVGSLQVQFRTDIESGQWGRPDLAGKIMSIPRSFSDAGATRLLWEPYKSGTVTKDGYDWKILWIAFDVEAYAKWMQFKSVITGAGISVQASARVPQVFDASGPAGSGGVVGGYGTDSLNSYFMAFDRFLVGGSTGSGIHGKTQPNERGNAVFVLMDLVEYYSAMGAAGVDGTRFGRALLANTIYVKGSISPGDTDAYSKDQQLSASASPFGVGTLRNTIAAIASTADLDVFVTMEGKVGVVSQAASFETQTMTPGSIDEARISNVTDRTPSTGTRWSPYNRVFMRWPDGVQRGPYDNATAITAWGRIISKVIDGTWWRELVRGDWQPPAVITDVAYVWKRRALEAKVRPVISFRTDLSVLAFDLGDFFTMSWTRGGQNSAHASAIWRLEGVTIRSMVGAVDVTAVWMGDIATEQPFLLDNEGLFLRVAGAGARTCTVTDASTTVTFASGSLITDGVAAGDILRLRDASEAAATFYRNRDLMVASVTDALNFVVSGDVDFGTAGAHVVTASDWEIVKGFTTYPSAATDPANYPSGGLMYGKICNSVAQFSDTTAANKLLNG